MSANEKKIYRIKLNGEYIAVSKEVYLEWYRPIWRTIRYAYRHGRCSSPNWQFCEGDCGLCRYRLSGNQMSLDEKELNIQAYGSDPSDLAEKKYMHEKMIQIMNKAGPEDQKILQLLQEGVDDRTAAKLLGLSKSAYSRRKVRLCKAIKHDLGVDT